MIGHGPAASSTLRRGAARHDARRWRLRPIALAVILVGFTFETGVHSAHHLDEDTGGMACALGWASSHLTGVSVGLETVQRVAPAVFHGIVVETRCHFALPPFPHHDDRAPPIIG